MPNIWTHNWFGDKVAEQSKLYVSPTDIETRNIYHLGCQGPTFCSIIIIFRGKESQL